MIFFPEADGVVKEVATKEVASKEAVSLLQIGKWLFLLLSQ